MTKQDLQKHAKCIFNAWNEGGAPKHSKKFYGKHNVEKALIREIQEISEEREINTEEAANLLEKCIKNYKLVTNDTTDKYFYGYGRWDIIDFLTRDNGRKILKFECVNDYVKDKSNNGTSQQTKENFNERARKLCQRAT